MKQSSTEATTDKREPRLIGVLFAGTGPTNTTIERAFNVGWSEAEIAAVLPFTAASEKSAVKLWSAATYRSGSTRGDAGIEAVHAAVLDLDAGNVGTLDEVCDWLETRRYAFVVHSAWSHRFADPTARKRAGEDRDSFRMILPYSRAVTPSEHRLIVGALYGHEVPTLAGWDPAALKPAQAWYLPACPPGREPHAVFEVHAGDPLDVDAILTRPAALAPLTPHKGTRLPVTAQGHAAMAALQGALDAHGFDLWSEGDWARATCPNCKDPAPSLRVLASGSGLIIKCHSTLTREAGCSRQEVLAAIGLDDDAVPTPRTNHLERLRAQLVEAVPTDELTADEAAQESAGRPANEIQALPPGTGKTHAKLRLALADDRPYRIMTPSHRLANEHAAVLDGASVSRIKSPLAVVDGMPTCLRVSEPGFKEHVRKARIDMRASVCPYCTQRKACTAWQENRSDARIILAPHAAGLPDQSWASIERADEEIIFDEEPEPFQRFVLTAARLEDLTAPTAPISRGGKGLRFWGLLQPNQQAVLQEFARALREGEAISEELLDAVLAFKGRLRQERGKTPASWARWPWFADTASALMGMAAAQKIERDEKGNLTAIVSSPARDAILEGRATLLSATPTPGAYGSRAIYRPAVKDGCAGIVREVHFSSASTKTDFLAAEGGPRRDRLDPILAALRARCVGCRVLLVTWKWLADWLSERPELLPSGTWVEHYGNLAGSNLYQEGGAREADVIVTLGDYRTDTAWMFEHQAREAGLTGEAAAEQVQAWRDQAAANELAQAHGRARDPRRTKPIMHLHFGKLAPTGWHAANTTVVSAYASADDKADGRALVLRLRAAGHGQRAIARACGVDHMLVARWESGERPVAPVHVPALLSLSARGTDKAGVAQVVETIAPVHGDQLPSEISLLALGLHSSVHVPAPLVTAVRELGKATLVARLGTSRSGLDAVLKGARPMPAAWAAKLARRRSLRVPPPAQLKALIATRGDQFWAPLSLAA